MTPGSQFLVALALLLGLDGAEVPAYVAFVLALLNQAAYVWATRDEQ